MFINWLVEFQFAAFVLLASTTLGLWFLRQPAQRMIVMKAALAALILLAGLCAMPGWALWQQSSATPVVQPPRPQLEIVPSKSDPRTVEIFAPAAGAIALPAPAASPPRWSWPELLRVLPTLFALGTLLVFAWLALGALIAWRLRRTAHAAQEVWRQLLAELTTPAAPPQLLVSERVTAPVALGLWRPAIILPSKLEASPTALRALLAHEWAHVKNGDLISLAVSRTLLAILWPQPLYWWFRRALRLDQERLADAAAAEVANRVEYAAELVAWARTATPQPLLRAVTPAIGLWESPSQLKRRLATLLDEQFTLLKQVSRPWRWSCGVLAMLTAVGLSLVAPERGQVARGKEVQNVSKSKQIDLGKYSQAYKKFYESHPQKPNVLQGICLDATGKPVPGVEISLYEYGIHADRSQEIRPFATQTSNAAGEFRFENVVDIAKDFPQGIPHQVLDYHDLKLMAIVGDKQGYAIDEGHFEHHRLAKWGEIIGVNCTSGVSLRGRVTDQQGNPIVGAIVNADRNAGLGAIEPLCLLPTARTDADGRYTISNLLRYDEQSERIRQEAWRKQFQAQEKKNADQFFALAASDPLAFRPRKVEIHHPDYTLKRAVLSAIPGELNATLSPGATIIGRATYFEDGREMPAVSSMIQLTRVVTDKVSSGPGALSLIQVETQRTVTDESGAFQIRSLPAGEYILDAESPETTWVLPNTQKLRVEAGQTVVANALEFTHGGIVRAKFIDATTKQPLTLPANTSCFLNLQPVSGAWRLSQTNALTSLSVQGIAERHVSPGKYRYFGSIHEMLQGRSLFISYANVKTPEQLNECTVTEGEVTEITIPMYPAPPPEVNGALIQTTQPNIEDPDADKKSSPPATEKPTATFTPYTTPAEEE